MIRVTVFNRQATAAPLSPVTSGSVGIPAEFVFSDDWESLTKTAVFKGSDEVQEVAVVDNACEIPEEVLTESGGMLWVGVYGADGQSDTVIPTNWALVGRIEEGTVLTTP